MANLGNTKILRLQMSSHQTTIGEDCRIFKTVNKLSKFRKFAAKNKKLAKFKLKRSISGTNFNLPGPISSKSPKSPQSPQSPKSILKTSIVEDSTSSLKEEEIDKFYTNYDLNTKKDIPENKPYTAIDAITFHSPGNPLERTMLKTKKILKSKFVRNEQIGYYRMIIANREVPCIPCTRCLGCFSGVGAGLTGNFDYCEFDVQAKDVAILMSSYELWETVGQSRMIDAISQGLRSKNLEMSTKNLFTAFDMETRARRRGNKFHHKDFNCSLLLLS